MLESRCTKNAPANNVVRRCRTGFSARAATAVLACLFTLALAGQASASRCVVDVDGANDDPGQKDVTQFCSGAGSNAPFDIFTSASFDLTSLAGGNTADLCLLFDSNSNGKIDLSLCTTLANAPAALSDVRLLSCDDSRSDRCNFAVKINVCSGSGKSCLSNAQCGTGETCAKHFNTVCDASQQSTDPFAAGDNSPWDTVVSCAIDLDEFGPAGATARLINMGAYSSSSLTSSMSDSVLPPACGSDADCPSGEVCHLASGECYKPKPTGCTDNSQCSAGEVCDVGSGACVPGGCTTDADCVAGKVCDVATGVCGTPTNTGCQSDADCATGFVCNVGTGICESTGGCTVNAECPSPLVCDATTGTCESPSDECSSDADCLPWQTCKLATGICDPPLVPCNSDSDCAAGQICDPDLNYCRPASGGGCTSSADCAAGEVCDVSTGTCHAGNEGGCTSDADCTSGETCNVGTGVCEPAVVTTTTTLPSGACTADTDCPVGEICNVSTGDCGAPSVCTSNTDCPSGEECNVNTGECVVPGSCTTNADCTNAGEVCEGGSCALPAGCLSDADCGNLDGDCGTGVCDQATGACSVVAANEGQACGGIDDACSIGGVCSSGECLAVPACDSECSLCDNGTCLPLCANPHDSIGSGVTIADALYILRTGVALEQCGLCVCDVDNSGRISAVDALHVLRSVVRLPETLSCPAHNTVQ